MAISDQIAATIIMGKVHRARIEQFHRSAYVAVWGDGYDIDCKVPSSNAAEAMRRAADGSNEYGAEISAVLRAAAVVFARADDSDLLDDPIPFRA